MERKKCGHSNLTLPVLGIGCWSFGGGSYWGDQNQHDVDAVADMAHLTGMNRLADAYSQITGKDCGCAGRQEKLNQLSSFNALRPS